MESQVEFAPQQTAAIPQHSMAAPAMAPEPGQAVVIRTKVQPRFSDFDALGHLNNAKYLEYVEVARLHAFGEVLGVDLRKVTAVMGTATVSFLRPIKPFEPLVLETTITEVRPRSIDLRVSFRSGTPGEAPRAIVDVRQVVIDTQTGKTRGVPDELATRIRDLNLGRYPHAAVATAQAL